MHGGDEFAFEPRFIGDYAGDGFAVDFRVGEVWVLGGGVVAPDAEIGDLGVVNACFGGELGFGAIFVEARHGEEAVARNACGVAHGDEGVGIAWVTDDEDADIFRGVLRDRLALAGENFAVDAEQITTFHASFAGNGADEESPVGVAETFGEVGGGNDFVEEGESAVVEFHDDALESGEGWLDFDEAEVDGLIGAEYGARSDAEQESVADLTCGACDGDSDGCFHKKCLFGLNGVRIAKKGGLGQPGREKSLGRKSREFFENSRVQCVRIGYGFLSLCFLLPLYRICSRRLLKLNKLVCTNVSD